MPSGSDTRVVLTSYREVREAFRQRDLAQAQYDVSAVVMAGTIMTLHGDDHRLRRRVENRLFRRGTFRWWEMNLVPSIVAESLAPFLAEGRADLIRLGHRTTMYLTALVAGVDLPATLEDADALEKFAVTFSEGATLVHSTRDPTEVNAEVEKSMAAFGTLFLEPSMRRRLALLDAVTAGELDEDELPRDVLMATLRYRDELGMDRDAIRREIAFYLQAGSHSTANLFAHAAHHIFTAMHDEGFAARLADQRFLQRCVHEALRLHPASPVAGRRALSDITLSSGRVLPAGTYVEFDLVKANSDICMFGSDAAQFNPDRVVPANAVPWGHSFGGGTHACIGMELDGGVIPSPESAPDHEHVFGTVTLMLRALLEHGARPDPDHPPARDADTVRQNFSRYPVRFA